MRTSFFLIPAIASLAICCQLCALRTNAGSDGKKPSDAEIEKLIKQLGSANAQTREASTKALLNIGEPALPFLRAAFQAKDAELRRRAEMVHAEIEVVVLERETQQLIARALGMGIDHMVDRMVLKGQKVKDEDWDAIMRIATIIKKRGIAKGARISLERDFLKDGVVVAKELREVQLADQRILAESVNLGAQIGNCLVVSGGNFSAESNCSKSILLVNGTTNIGSVLDSIIVCSGKITCLTVNRSVLLCSGDVKLEAGLHESVILSNGTIEVLSADKSYVGSRGSFKSQRKEDVEKNQILSKLKQSPCWPRFFATADLGINTEAADKKVKVAAVAKDSPLYRAGIKVGDTILAIDDVEILDQEVFRNALRKKSLGQATVLSVRRDMEAIKIAVKFHP